MVLRVDHHDDSMVETSFTCAEALGAESTQSASSREPVRAILEDLLKFFIMMWFENPIHRSAPDPDVRPRLWLARLCGPHHNHFFLVQVRCLG